jgi:hypothetical protein
MSKKEEIKNALIMDLENSPQQQYFNIFLDEAKASINNPDIQDSYAKYFNEPIDLNTQAIYKLISQKDLGFECIVRDNLIGINFIDFLK